MSNDFQEMLEKLSKSLEHLKYHYELIFKPRQPHEPVLIKDNGGAWSTRQVLVSRMTFILA